ncbi:2-isopropylmalate synthase [Sporotomaculum syntrophicum]|uniref:Citramalate synthase n=1 Tax=Sporotomaculum syntrophicum TaxID=182264 RepID=A0A9D2WR45_9FIRM|nr:citramalate synthase [Sporotomaculum syntrophicum]KAF1085072.1 2-isopropylmalate synthase [Sporotomaculum syntrophicum]
MPRVEIYDTTLRDGTQGEGISLSAKDKVKIALKLDELGFHYIEGGWPGSNPKDLRFFELIREHQLKNARICAFGSTRKSGTAADQDENLQQIVRSKAPVATIFGKTWDFHVTHALMTTLEDNLNMIEESVAYLKQQGMEVFYDAEHFFDGFIANREYALATLQAAKKGGAARIILCDTNGGHLPNEIFDLVSAVKQVIDLPLGIHCHNDSELAVANSITAVQAGVIQVQGTINGYGERCGNANLISIIPNLAFKCHIPSLPEESLAELTDLSRFVSELANMHPMNNQPFVGGSAFAHKAGVHVNALLKNPQTYEHLEPEKVGNRRRVLVSELSGLSNLVYKYQESDLGLGLGLEKEDNRKLLDELKELENQGYQFEGAEGSFELRVRKAFYDYQEPFTLESLKVLIELREGTVYSEAIIKIKVNGQVMHTAAEGNGPVNALDNALRKALEGFYPEISSFQLNDYKVRVLDEKEGTGAVVRVLVESGDGHSSWGTVGVSPNIIEASWEALVDSIAYGLLRLENKGELATDQIINGFIRNKC